MSAWAIPARALTCATTIVLGLAFSCSKKDQPAPTVRYVGTLAVDIRQSAEVSLTPRANDELAVELKLTDPGYPTAATNVTTKGRIERFPEASMTMYSSQWSSAADPKTPCGTSPLALALSLTRRADNARVGGALTVYCGDKAVGIPARVFRLSGDLPLGP